MKAELWCGVAGSSDDQNGRFPLSVCVCVCSSSLEKPPPFRRADPANFWQTVPRRPAGAEAQRERASYRTCILPVANRFAALQSGSPHPRRAFDRVCTLKRGAGGGRGHWGSPLCVCDYAVYTMRLEQTGLCGGARHKSAPRHRSNTAVVFYSLIDRLFGSHTNPVTQLQTPSEGRGNQNLGFSCPKSFTTCSFVG